MVGSDIKHADIVNTSQPTSTAPRRWRSPKFVLWSGVVASTLIFLGSFGGGAIRYRDGVLRALHLDFLSYGHGAGISNTVIALGIIGVIFAWGVMGRAMVFRLDVDERCHWQPLTKILAAWLVPLVFAAPIMSRDVYSYLMQGAMLRDGHNPYSEGAAANPGPMLLEVSHDWRNTTTPYGPLHLWLGEGITRIVGDSVTAGVFLYKIVSLAGFALIAWSVPRIAELLGGNPRLALWLGVANPVMVLHLVGGMHNESIMVGLVSVGLYLVLRGRFFSGVGLAAIAVALKATAAIALPFFVWIAMHYWARAWAQRSGRDKPSRFQWAGSFFAAAIAGAVETLGVVAVITLASGTSWEWIAEISGNSKVINPLALPTFFAGLITDFVTIFNPDFAFNAPLSLLRSVFSVLMLLGLVVVWWYFRTSPTQAVRGIVFAYGVAFLCNSVTLPWYYASLLSLIAVAPIRRTPAMWAAGLSMVVTLAFTGSGNHQLYNAAWMFASSAFAWVFTVWTFTETSQTSRDTQQWRGVTPERLKEEPALQS
ncbi:alpha mannopyranosyltransferase [Corynebacterium renale]|nr:alpha mannopyranosyltransferase [Corynebacterium renale]